MFLKFLEKCSVLHEVDNLLMDFHGIQRSGFYTNFSQQGVWPCGPDPSLRSVATFLSLSVFVPNRRPNSNVGGDYNLLACPILATCHVGSTGRFRPKADFDVKIERLMRVQSRRINARLLHGLVSR